MHQSNNRRSSVKKGFLEISQNLHENTCARVSFATSLKKKLWHRRFHVNFAKFLRTPFLQNTYRRLLLTHQAISHLEILSRISSTKYKGFLILIGSLNHFKIYYYSRKNKKHALEEVYRRPFRWQ